MPTYDYVCQNCGAELELVQSIVEPAYKIYRHPHAKPATKTVDAVCSGEVKRVISKGATFVLKGGGWADDGYSK